MIGIFGCLTRIALIRLSPFKFGNVPVAEPFNTVCGSRRQGKVVARKYTILIDSCL